MKSGGNSFNYYPENNLTKLANLAQFKPMLMSYLEDCGRGEAGPGLPPAVYATESANTTVVFHQTIRNLTQSSLRRDDKRNRAPFIVMARIMTHYYMS